MSKDKPTEAVAAEIRRHLEAQEKIQAPYEKALGKLSMKFTLLHFLLEVFSWEIWNLNGHLALVITKDLPTKHLAEKMRASAAHAILKENDRKTFCSILKKVEKAAEQRNEFLHSLWIITAGEPVFCLSRRRGRLIGADAPSVSEINALTKTIRDIIIEFETFKQTIRARRSFGFGLDLEP